MREFIDEWGETFIVAESDIQTLRMEWICMTLTHTERARECVCDSRSKINPNVYVGGSIGTYLQTEHLLTTADNGYPNDIWVPSTDNIPFQRSNQIELFSEIEEGAHSFRLSAYYSFIS